MSNNNEMASQKFKDYKAALEALGPINSEDKAAEYRRLFEEYHGCKLNYTPETTKPIVKYKIARAFTVYRDGGTKAYKVIKPKDCFVVYQDFRINSKTKGKFFTEYPSDKNAVIIPDNQIEFI